MNSEGQSPLTPPGIGEGLGNGSVTPHFPPFPSGTYEDGEKPPVPCLRVSKALDPKGPGHKYFLPQ